VTAVWDLFKSFSLANQIGVIGAFLGYAAGMAAVFVVDPIAGAVITGGSLLLVAFCIWFFFGAEVRRRHLLKRGTSGWATILAVEETGITINRNYPVAKLRLQVEPAQGQPYEVTAKCLMNRFDIPVYQPGARVAVVIDPRNPRKVGVA
jgi:hypothetical protein